MHALLDSDTIARAEALGLLARHVVDGPHGGANRSPRQGASVEFAQHRPYAPGDDLRRLDWKVLARSDHYVVKQYRQETDYACHLLVDASGSMDYGDGDAHKMTYARRLAACLAYAVLRQRDAVSLVTFDAAVSGEVPTTGNLAALRDVLATLVRVEPRGPTDLPAVLERVAGRTRRRGIVVVVSDLLDDEEAILAGVRRLTFGGHEVVVFHVLHPDERTFAFDGPVQFEGLEGDATITTRPSDVRRSYLAAFDAFCQKVRGACLSAGCHYVLHDTGRPLHEAVGEYLAFRSTLTR